MQERRGRVVCGGERDRDVDIRVRRALQKQVEELQRSAMRNLGPEERMPNRYRAPGTVDGCETEDPARTVREKKKYRVENVVWEGVDRGGSHAALRLVREE